MPSYRITDAARLLGVSDDTVRRWIDRGALPTTGASPAEIPGEALAARALEHVQSATDPTDVLSSARNRFTGLVTRVTVDGSTGVDNYLRVTVEPHNPRVLSWTKVPFTS